jgi:xanthine dehydrogenase accessory factor
MFGISLSAAACLRAGTRIDVAWVVDRPDGRDFDPADAVAITPGGGRLGALMAGALDGQLIELAGVGGAHGRLHRLEIGPADAAVSGLEPTSDIACLLVPGTDLPGDLWDRLAAREPVCLVSELESDNVVATSLYTAESIANAGEGSRRLFDRGTSATDVTEHAVTTVLWPRPTMVIVGGGEIADSLERLATLMGWQAVVTQNAGDAVGLIAGLASLDSLVVLGHDIELTGRAVMAALSGDAGYIGAVGPEHLHETRADWLAYRGVTDLGRLRGPAGLDIGARNPKEIALSIAAQVVATQSATPE